MCVSATSYLQEASYHALVRTTRGLPVGPRWEHHGSVDDRPSDATGRRPGHRDPAAVRARPGPHLVGDRWSFLLVEALLDGPRRFGELQVAVAGIATNVLTQRLRSLEATRVVVARPYSVRPRRVAYELSSAGRELAGALRLLAQWAPTRRRP